MFFFNAEQASQKMAGVRCDTGEELLPVFPRVPPCATREEVPSPASSASTRGSDLGNLPTTVASRSVDFCEYIATHPTAVVIGIRGNWYDVTSFQHRHPGGALLVAKMHGKDCTEAYEAFHEKDYVKFFPVIGHYKIELQEMKQNDIRKRFRDLGEEFKREGLFETSYSWYALKFAFILSLLAISVLIIQTTEFVSCTRAIIAGIFLGIFWQQSGFVMHDAMHSDITHNSKIDRIIGFVFGSFFLGFSAHWWRDEHFQHHAFTNVIDPSSLYADPQMVEEAWVQDRRLFPTLVGPRPAWKRFGQRILTRIQGWGWIVLAMFLGRIAIAADAMHEETRWYEWMAFIAHNGIILRFFCSGPFSLGTAFAYYYAAALAEGILHVQLLVNHYPKPWSTMQDLFERVSWPVLQTTNTLNIRTPWWADWFYGGLNFHIEHHLYPNMPRHNFSKAQKRIKDLCKEVGLPYDETDFLDSIIVSSRKIRHLSSELQSWWKSPVCAQWREWFDQKEKKTN